MAARATLAASVFCLLAGPAWSGGHPDDLATLRNRALAAVNADRTRHGLAELRQADTLAAAAQDHADDMLERHYFAHQSPEGDDARDRYLRHGGSKWRLIAENIAQCKGCDPPIAASRVDALEHGWMNSPEHRANILTAGLDRFGFGIAVDEDGLLYAVQTFSGAGAPLGSAPGPDPTPLSLPRAAELTLGLVNAARSEQDLPALQQSDLLADVAGALVRQVEQNAGSPDLADAVTDDVRRQFEELQANSATCGGCGAALTDADLAWLNDQWLDGDGHSAALLDHAMTAFGFAAKADGQGRKIALAVVGRQR